MREYAQAGNTQIRGIFFYQYEEIIKKMCIRVKSVFQGLYLWLGIIAMLMMLNPAIAAATETVTSANSSVAWWV